MKDYTINFNKNLALSNLEQVELLGGKGFGLNQMNKMGLPVPEGFTIPTTFCGPYQKKQKLTKLMRRSVEEQIKNLVNDMSESGKVFQFGNIIPSNGMMPTNPLMLSVRSGAAVSMPGMMDTILNIGLSNQIIYELGYYADETVLKDGLRRLYVTYSNAVNPDAVEENERVNSLNHVYEQLFRNSSNSVIKQQALCILLGKLDEIVDLPEDPMEQLEQAILTVFRSWHTDRAVSYRELEGLDDVEGTAVTVQRMVMGNSGPRSGTGVMFSRNPNTGDKGMFGDFLVDAQGEDVVAGTHNTMSLDDMKTDFPVAFDGLSKFSDQLETLKRDMVDVEFTIEKDELFILQVRSGKRTAIADTKINLDLLNEGLIDQDEFEARAKAQTNIVTSEPESGIDESFIEIAEGKGACPGIVVGKAHFGNNDIVEDGFILIREKTEPDAIALMKIAKGIATTQGGLVSHAAVIARSWNKPCVVGASKDKNGVSTFIGLDYLNTQTIVIHENDVVALDGTTGKVYLVKRNVWNGKETT